jgi:hypothetical protein
MTGGSRKLHGKEFRNLYSLPNRTIIRMDWACSAHGGDGKRTQTFVCNARRKQTTLKTSAYIR